MTRMTIATDTHGNVLGAIQHANGKGGDNDAGVTFGPGAELHVVDVGPELDMAKATDAVKFHDALKKHVLTVRQ